MNAKTVQKQIKRLVEEYRDRCLWFLREDYYPVTLEQQLRTLRHIERHGDREAFRRAAELRKWLSQNSKEPSAVS
ncbi:MAG: hypothetical protein JXR37_36985 [Kiritimatiellae bacterium]|nr:hypothetical protein [Kiritimatiellia bacterium]